VWFQVIMAASMRKYCAEQPRTSTTTFRWCLLPPSASDKYLPTDEDSKHIRNVGLRLRDCTAHYARRLSSSCGALPEIPINLHKMVKTKMFTLCDILRISWKRQVIIPNVRALSLWLIIKRMLKSHSNTLFSMHSSFSHHITIGRVWKRLIVNHSALITVKEWYSTRRPLHCDHYWSIVRPHLSANHSWFIPNSSLANTSRDT
jgi:hypothetical protein